MMTSCEEQKQLSRVGRVLGIQEGLSITVAKASLPSPEAAHAGGGGCSHAEVIGVLHLISSKESLIKELKRAGSRWCGEFSLFSQRN